MPKDGTFLEVFFFLGDVWTERTGDKITLLDCPNYFPSYSQGKAVL
jgi:hypothetical protein